MPKMAGKRLVPTMPALAAGFVAFWAPSAMAALVDCGKPTYMTQKPAICTAARGEILLKPCAEFRAAETEAFTGFGTKMQEVCSFLNTNAGGACTGHGGATSGPSQQCVQFETSRLTKAAAAKLGEMDAALAEYHRKVEEAKKALLNAVRYAKIKACLKLSRAGAAPRNCEFPYQKPENGPEPLLKAVQARLNVVAPSEVRCPAGEPGSLFREQCVLANEMFALQSEITRERELLKVKGRELEHQGHTAQTRGEKLGGDQNPSDITDGDHGPTAGSPEQKQPEQPQGGGGSGGGSPGGGEQSPSSVTDQGGAGGTSPTPTSHNDGKGLADAKDKSDDKSKAPGGLNNNPVDLSNLRKGSTSNLAGGGGFPDGGRTLASDKEERDTTFKANSSAPVSGHANGGGSGGGGGSGSLASAKEHGVPAEAESAPPEGGSYPGSPIGSSGGGGSGGSEENLSPFGKPLGDPKMDLAGSETDASVKEILSEMSGEMNDVLGSPEDFEDGIGKKNTASLFDRARAYHERCLQKGCVTGFQKRSTMDEGQ